MLHELLEYARRENLASEPGFKSKPVKWLLQFTPDGNWIAPPIDLTDGDKRSKGREFNRCPDLTQPEMISSGSRHFLADSLDKVVLLTKEEATEKDCAAHASFVGLLDKASSAIPELAPISATLNNEEILTAIQANLNDLKAKPTDSATIAVSCGHKPHIFIDSDEWHNWWRGFRGAISQSKASNSARKKTIAMRCYLSGELVEPAATQNKVTGLSDVGGQATGDVISSFDKEAFGHFEFEQGQNAAISEEMVKSFTDALNHLIKRRSIRMAETRIVYWYSRDIAAEEDVVRDIFAGAGLDEDDGNSAKRSTKSEPSERQILQAESTARKLLEAIRSGQRDDLKGCQFFALTLSGNSGRVIIRDWMQGSFEQLVESIDAWFSDLAIVSRDGKNILNRHKFAALLAATVRDLKDVPSPAVATLWRCALNKSRSIPDSMIAQCLHRVRIDIVQDQSPRAARIGLLRAFCIRKPGVPAMTAELDETVDDPAYLSGRIMALLAAVQEAALGNVGAGVVQRYYAAASATPALVLGRLVRTAQIAHLPKLEGGLRHYFESQLTDVWNRMKSTPPTTLSLEKQTLFAMGYYQQKAVRGKRSGNLPESESSE
ncbi:MAG: type I-C CRISPR-associated protein Cas8c/Csd1 [Pirellulaceae bacterium]|nr:type I-C CRISPR-associated protein Cas8c/Csd1 [Pirellulaceae bacterium]